jgi:hypothetical protein
MCGPAHDLLQHLREVQAGTVMALSAQVAAIWSRQLGSHDTTARAPVSKMERAFTSDHGGGDGRLLHRKRAAEAAAGRGLAHLHQLQPLHMSQQLAGRLAQVELAQAVAAIVKRDPAIETGARIA